MRPRLGLGVRVRVDRRDGASVLLSPERGLRLGETAAAVVELCDGTRTFDAIVDALTVRYAGADRERVAADVGVLLADLRSRGLIVDFTPGLARANVRARPRTTTLAPAPDLRRTRSWPSSPTDARSRVRTARTRGP